MKNLDVLQRIMEAVDIPIQIGGGIRTYEQVKQLFEIGVYRVVLGTAAIDIGRQDIAAKTEPGCRADPRNLQERMSLPQTLFRVPIIFS